MTNVVDFIPPTRRIPHSIEAEMAFLGAVIVDNRAYDRPSIYLRPEHFALAAHRIIYSAYQAIASDGRPITPEAVVARLQNNDELAPVGGTVYIHRLVESGVTVGNGWEYGRLIHDLFLRRELIDLGENIVNKAYSEDDGEKQVAAAENVLSLLPTVAPQPKRRQRRSQIDAADMSVALTQMIPPRKWLLGTMLCQGYVTMIVASGGAGKTSLAILMAIACASGQPIAGEYVHRRSRVLVLSLEDDTHELYRRVRACAMHHGITESDLSGRLYGDSLAGLDCRLITVDEQQQRAETALVRSIMDTIHWHQIDVVIIDPLVKASGSDENDNRAADWLAQVLVKIASQSDVAILAVHHTRKGANEPGDIDVARGAGSLKDAVRIGLTVTKMSEDEARMYAIDEADRKSYVRVDDAKVNLTPSSEAHWYHLSSVAIGNATTEYPNGDNVQAAEPWSPPDIWAGVSKTTANAVLDDIAAGTSDGDLYGTGQGGAGNADRAAWKVVERHFADKSPGQCKAIINAWVRSGVLTIVDYQSPSQRKTRKGYAVADDKRPS